MSSSLVLVTFIFIFLFILNFVFIMHHSSESFRENGWCLLGNGEDKVILNPTKTATHNSLTTTYTYMCFFC